MTEITYLVCVKQRCQEHLTGTFDSEYHQIAVRWDEWNFEQGGHYNLSEARKSVTGPGTAVTTPPCPFSSETPWAVTLHCTVADDRPALGRLLGSSTADRNTIVWLLHTKFCHCYFSDVTVVVSIYMYSCILMNHEYCNKQFISYQISCLKL